MGVRGLFLHCQSLPHIAVEYDLVALARNKGTVDLIVDFYAFEYWIIQQMSILMSQNEDNPWVELSGGEYSVAHILTTSFISFLKEESINPIFVMDGAKFSTNAQARFKFDEWVRRDGNDWSRVKKMLDMIDGTLPLGTLSRREYIRPVLIEIEMVRCLRSLNVEMHCCCSGEADMYIAKLFADRRAVAILSNDSDFLVFPNCCMIAIDTNFDIDHHLRKSLVNSYENGRHGIHLERLLVRCIKSNDVAESMGLENAQQMFDLAFIRGNDASKPFTDMIHKALNIAPTNFSALCRFVRKNQPLEKEPTIARFMRNYEEFRMAYEITQHFYSLNFAAMPSDDDVINDVKLENYICRGVADLALPPQLLAISRGYHWCRVLVEMVKFDNVCSVSETAMTPFRRFLFQMSVSRNLPSNLATEYFVLPRLGLQECRPSVPSHKWLPRLDQIPDMPRSQRKDIFHRILTHQEENEYYQSPNLAPKFPNNWRNAFCVYVCRYFVLLNKNRNLHIRYEEMLSVIASVFGTTDSNVIVSESVSCRPSPRSLAVAAWLQNIYRHAGGFLARMLGLEDEIPPPHEFFSGSVFTAFFFCNQTDARRNPTVQRICNLKNSVLQTRSHEKDLIMASCF